jgi:hypothetical protein
MARRALPALLAVVAASSDLAGAHGLALVALLGAIPAAFVLVLDCYGDALAGRCGNARPVVAAAALALLVLSATLRSPAVVGGVPRVAVSAVALCVLLYAANALVAARPTRVRVAASRARVAEPSDVDERRAA